MPRLDEPREYETYPPFIVIRELKFKVEIKSFRTREIIVYTSLLDDTEYGKDHIVAMFCRRWEAELNLRSLKTVMQMDHLRCKEPHRVRNELRSHTIAYNLIRQVMAEAAIDGGLQP